MRLILRQEGAVDARDSGLREVCALWKGEVPVFFTSRSPRWLLCSPGVRSKRSDLDDGASVIITLILDCPASPGEGAGHRTVGRTSLG